MDAPAAAWPTCASESFLARPRPPCWGGCPVLLAQHQTGATIIKTCAKSRDQDGLSAAPRGAARQRSLQAKRTPQLRPGERGLVTHLKIRRHVQVVMTSLQLHSRGRQAGSCSAACRTTDHRRTREVVRSRCSKITGNDRTCRRSVCYLQSTTGWLYIVCHSSLSLVAPAFGYTFWSIYVRCLAKASNCTSSTIYFSENTTTVAGGHVDSRAALTSLSRGCHSWRHSWAPWATLVWGKCDNSSFETKKSPRPVAIH